MHENNRRLSPDIFISVVIALVFFGTFFTFDLMEKWFDFTRAYEDHELDEVIGLIFGFIVGLLYFTFRLLVHVQKDNTRIYSLAKSLEYEASYDHLTTLPNRREFEKKIRNIIDESKHTNSSFTLLYIDLDSFKYINDTLGHTIGDKLLILIAERLSAIDIKNHFVARIGGDEFCLAIPGYANNQTCQELCWQLDESITRQFIIDSHKLSISHTVGIGRFPEDGSSYEVLLQNTHIAMCIGKTSGQRRNNFKNGDFTHAMKIRFLIQHSLKDALKSKQLYVEYQPKINLLSNQLIGAEALVRWKHHEYGFIAPDEFIYIAEETHNIHLIDFFVLEEVCKQINLWGDIANRIAINLSPILFADENLVSKIMVILKKYNISPLLVEFEITERTIVAESGIPLVNCQKLVSEGFAISLDDFGTGYSSLAHIANFPISILKIDRGFISKICECDRTRNIVIAIISLAKALNIKVIAEGIETNEQRIMVTNLSCDEAQGYFFDRPLSKDVYFERLTQANSLIVTPNSRKL